MIIKQAATVLCATIGVVLSVFAAPQLIFLDTGERVVGEVLPKSTEDTVFLQSSLLGEMTIPRARVLRIEPQPALDVAKKAPAVAKKVPALEAEPVPTKQMALTEEEVDHIEERRVIDTLREFKAPDSWNGNLRMGLNLSQGDNKWNETYARGNLEIKPKGSPNFYRFTGSYTYRETERNNGTSFKSTDKYDGNFIYRRTFYDNWFVQNSIGIRVDQVKGIDRELQEAVGVGYKFKPTSNFEFLIGGGGGVEELETDFEDTRTGLNPLMNVFQEATWRPWKRTSLVQKFNYYWNPEQSEQFNYVVTAAVRFRLTDLVGLEFSYNKDFDNDVGNGNSKDDTQWRNALVVYF
jgi:putative salt-induced outer membrane protein YdiY